MSSVEELRAALAQVQDNLRTAQYQVRTASELLAQADSGFVEAGADHSTSLVPPQLPRAGDQLDQLITRLATIDTMIEEYSFRL